MPKLRILVVEDSLSVRKRMLGAFAEDPQIEVVGEAPDGRMGIEMCRQLHPDVLTLDMVLPVCSGLAVTEYIMAYCPTPILIVSSSSNRGEVYKTCDALAAGALDVLEKPSGYEDAAEWDRRLVSTVKLISRIRVITHPRGRLAGAPPSPSAALGSAAPRLNNPAGYRVVAIGASTGGPAAVAHILESLPPAFPIPILLVTHIAALFGEFLAEWLDSRSSLPVRCAVDGERLPELGDARVIMARPNLHLVLDRDRLRLDSGPERHSCRPSIDVLFESVARAVGSRGIGCLLTGMGCDGAAGLLHMRREGGRTLVQDEATSTIFGMPREAIRMGAAGQVLGLPDFAPSLMQLASNPPSGGSVRRLPSGSGTQGDPL